MHSFVPRALPQPLQPHLRPRLAPARRACLCGSLVSSYSTSIVHLLINSTKVSLVYTFRSSEALCPHLPSTPLPPASPFPFILHLSRFICPCFSPEPWYIPTITDIFVVPCNSCAVLPHSEFCF